MPKEIIRDEAGMFDVELTWGRFEGDVQIATIMREPQTDEAPSNLIELTKQWDEQGDADPAIYQGLHCTLDRHSINSLIFFLRKARDQAMGKDQ